ncbi:MAG: pirin family protein [Actinomycetota bacterium]
MTDRTVAQYVAIEPQPGSGIIHPFPTPDIPHLDPFVFLDTGAPSQLGTGSIHVAPHPHRGVQPVSLVFRAEIEHRDSLGNHVTVSSGGMQWLVAGSGALHEEVLRGDAEGVFHMAQLWVNVHSEDKMSPPRHHAVAADDVPVLDLADGASVRLFAGELAGAAGPAPLGTPVLIAHVALDAGAEVRIPAPRGWTTAVCVVAGEVGTGERDGLVPGATAVLADDGDAVAIRSTDGGEALFLAGQPIGEPIVMGGGFVVTDDRALAEAFADLEAGLFGELEASR